MYSKNHTTSVLNENLTYRRYQNVMQKQNSIFFYFSWIIDITGDWLFKINSSVGGLNNKNSVKTAFIHQKERKE